MTARRSSPLPLALAACLALVGAVLAATPAAAVAPGCTAARPTALGGGIQGIDGRALNAVVGIDLVDASGARVDRDGRPVTAPGYVYRDRVNPTTSPDGSDDPSLTRTWGDPATSGDLCVATKVAKAYLEVYPQNEARYSVTTKSRYALAAHHAQTLRAGARNDVLLRLPLVRRLGGQVGYVAGYVTYRGAAVDPAKLVIRVFPRRAGSECGIEGFSAAPDQKFVTGGRTRYVSDDIAGGRCGAPSQTYDVRITCSCGGTPIVRRTFLEVASGKGTPFSVAF